MHRWLFIAISGLSLSCSVGTPSSSSGTPTESADTERSFTCAGGCETAPSLNDDELDRATFEHLLEAVAAQPIGDPSIELETLLFHSAQTKALIAAYGPGPLSASQASFLNDQLTRDQVRVEMRVLDAQGRSHATLSPEVIPLVDKQHLHLHTEGQLGELIAGGRVRRVGVNHLWSRW